MHCSDMSTQVKRFSLHSKPVRHISFDDKAEYVASCCGENYVSVSSNSGSSAAAKRQAAELAVAAMQLVVL